MRQKPFVLLLLTSTLLCLAGCERNGTGPTETGLEGNVSLSIGAPSSLSNGAYSAAKLEGLSGNVVTLTRVRLLLAEIELESVNEDSADFEIGPLVVDLNLEGLPTVIGVGSIPIGLYEELEFEVAKIDEDDEVDLSDPQFADFKDTEKSIIIEGVYNSEVFTLAIEEDFEQESELVPPLEIVSDTSSTNVTLIVSVDDWFVGSDSTEILDPTDSNNIDRIEENIERSFEAFEDDDGDGELDFEGEVSSVNLDNNSFALTNGLTVVTDTSTVFEGSIESLETVENLLSQGEEVKAEGEGYRQDDGSILATEVEFETDD